MSQTLLFVKLVALTYFLVFCSFCDHNSNTGVCGAQKSALPSVLGFTNKLIQGSEAIRTSAVWKNAIEPNVVFPVFIRIPSSYFYPPLEPYYLSGLMRKEFYYSLRVAASYTTKFLQHACKFLGNTWQKVGIVWDRTIGETYPGMVLTKETGRMYNILANKFEQSVHHTHVIYQDVTRSLKSQWKKRYQPTVDRVYDYYLLPSWDLVEEKLTFLTSLLRPTAKYSGQILGVIFSRVKEALGVLDAWAEANVQPLFKSYVVPVVMNVHSQVSKADNSIRRGSAIVADRILQLLDL
jgi:hypothetical protein